MIFSPASASAAGAGGAASGAGLPTVGGSANGSSLAGAGWALNGSNGAAAMPDAASAAMPDAALGTGGYGSAPAGVSLAEVAPGGRQPAVRQLGFLVQTNSSVQWFKGKYQHPNTYMQVRRVWRGWQCACLA